MDLGTPSRPTLPDDASLNHKDGHLCSLSPEVNDSDFTKLNKEMKNHFKIRCSKLSRAHKLEVYHDAQKVPKNIYNSAKYIYKEEEESMAVAQKLVADRVIELFADAGTYIATFSGLMLEQPQDMCLNWMNRFIKKRGFELWPDIQALEQDIEKLHLDCIFLYLHGKVDEYIQNYVQNRQKCMYMVWKDTLRIRQLTKTPLIVGETMQNEILATSGALKHTGDCMNSSVEALTTKLDSLNVIAKSVSSGSITHDLHGLPREFTGAALEIATQKKQISACKEEPT